MNTVNTEDSKIYIFFKLHFLKESMRNYLKITLALYSNDIVNLFQNKAVFCNQGGFVELLKF